MAGDYRNRTQAFIVILFLSSISVNVCAGNRFMTLLSITPLVVAGLTATFFLLIIGYLTLQFRYGLIGRVAVLILACASLYSFLFTLSLATVDPTLSLILVILQLPLRLFLPVLSFYFILLYIGEIERITPRMIALTCLIPALVLIVAMTPSLHNLFVIGISSTIIDERLIFWFTPGPFFWLSHLYSSVLVIAGLSLAVSRFFRSPPVYRIQIVAILLAFVVPFFMHNVLIFMPDSLFSVALVLGGFILTAVALYVATSRYQFLTLTPVAIPVLFDQMTDGVIIVNIQNKVVEVNPAAARIIGTDRNTLIGVMADSLVPDVVLSDPGCGKGLKAPRTITLPLDGQPHYYDLRHIPLCGYDRVPGGNIILLHDSHTRHLTELGLVKSNEKLQLLTSITRHDILNTLTALMGSLQLARAGPLPKETDHYLTNAENHAELLQSQIEFTRDYQTLGLQSAQWQKVKNALDPYLPGLEKTRIFVDPLLADVVVFADPMLGRVFYNMIDNSLRHGGHIAEIRIRGQESGEEFLITYEDNGAGILQSDKERIFNKGYGKNTGLGLFLTREILALTRIQIRETGIYGEGVRFEIHVPHGAYRIVRDKV